MLLIAYNAVAIAHNGIMLHITAVQNLTCCLVIRMDMVPVT